MGGAESLFAIRLFQVTNLKGKKFLVNDITN